MAEYSWHTRLEKDLIRDRGGTPRKSYGPDGTIDGKPVEVRVARDGDKFRLEKSVHKELVRENGSYIFDKIGDGKPSKMVPASEVSDKLGRGEWGKDRSYRQKFLGVDDIF